MSGRSLGPRKIELRVQVTVDYDGRLSETGSIMSVEEYALPGRGPASDFSLDLDASPEEDFDDDDSRTISSMDTGSRRNGSSWSHLLPVGSEPHSSRANLASLAKTSSSTLNEQRPPRNGLKSTHSPSLDEAKPPPLPPKPPRDSMSSVYTDGHDRDYDQQLPNRGLAWLRDQEARLIQSKMGPSPSESDEASLRLEDDADSRMEGDLALEMDPRGRYYYSYQGSSQAPDEDQFLDDEKPRPTSMQIAWITNQRVDIRPPPSSSPSHTTNPLPRDPRENEIPREYLELMPAAAPTQAELEECSQCGLILDFMRYICANCDGKPCKGNHKTSPSRYNNPHTYPPNSPIESTTDSSASGSGSRTLVEISETSTLGSHFQIDGMSTLGSHFDLPSPTHLEVSAQKKGYRLCPNCIGSVGVTHAVDASLDTDASPQSSPSTPMPTSNWLRSAPTHKGQRRHAYREQMWGHMGWEDVSE